MDFAETDEQRALRDAVAALGAKYGHEYYNRQARSGGRLTELWQEAGRLGFIGVNLPEEYGGGGAGLYELALVLEELGSAGCGLLMLVVSPAICGTIIARFGTEEQKQRWLPGIADGSAIMAFGITEPDAGSNSHKLTTVGTRDGDTWVLNGRKIYISGVDEAAAVLIVGRTADSKTGKLRPALFAVPIATPGFSFEPIEMDLVMPEKQYLLFLDDVRLPADALIGEEGAALLQLFAGLNPERIMAAALAIGSGRFALDKAVGYVRERTVWDVPIGAHQGVAHPLAQAKVEIELAKLMMQKAATLCDGGDDIAAGEAANIAKYAAAEASVRAVDQAIQSLGGSSMTQEFGLASMLATARVGRIAPVSREMILNYVAQHSLGLPRSY
ncbi:MAG TPA: acyl-CoA dehydrogenase family protein [Streptosporangiaceae bacterium]